MNVIAGDCPDSSLHPLMIPSMFLEDAEHDCHGVVCRAVDWINRVSVALIIASCVFILIGAICLFHANI